MLMLSGILDENCIRNFCDIKKANKEERDKLNFLILENLYFNDDIWDFSKLNKYNRSEVNYKFKFSSIDNQYKYYAKLVVLNEVINNKCKIQTVHKYYANIVTIVNCFIREGVIDSSLISLSFIKKYISKIEKENSPSYVCRIAVVLNKLLKVIEEVENRELKIIIEYLDEKAKELDKFRGMKSQHEYIPDVFLDNLLKCAIDDSKNEKYNLTYRIFTCLLIILAETGMRIEELGLLESGKLNTIRVGGREVNYLNFISPKAGSGLSEVKFTYCYMTDLGTSAYRRAEELVNLLIKSLSNSVKDKLYLKILKENFPNKMTNEVNIENLNDGVDTETLKKIEQIAKRYLFISHITGMKIGDISNLWEYYMRFIINNYDKLSNINLSDKQQEELSYFNINSIGRFEKFFGRGNKKNANFDDIKEINYPYVNFHRFRVTVCTKLFKQGIPLDYIRNHMNHIENDMTIYYIKTEKIQDELKENIEMMKLVSDEEGYLKIEDENSEIDDIQNYNERVEKINKFLKTNKINLNTDINKIVRIFKNTNSFILDNDLGICLRTVVNGICNRQKYFSSLNDNYHIGLTLNTFKYIDCNYDRFVQKKIIIDHNRSIAKNDEDLKFEVERECKALVYFLEKTLLKEIELLENDISKFGKNDVISRFPNLREIVNKIEIIKKEVNLWMNQ